MNKNLKKFLISFFFMLLSFSCVSAAPLWDINYASSLYRNQDFNSAKKYLIEYIAENPNDEDGYYWLAKTYSSLKEPKKANEYYKKAYEFALSKRNLEKIDFSDDTDSNLEDYFDMAAMYFEAGDFKEADNYADIMLKIDPKSSSAYFIKAKIAQITGENTKATEYIKKAIIFNNKLLKTNLAKSLNVKQLPEMTLEMYEIFALEAYFSSDSASAIRYCKKYLEINENNVEISNLLIDLYIKNNELDSAQALIDKVLGISSNIQTMLYQAKIYELKKDERLESTLLGAYKINPNNSDVLLELGNYYLKNKDFANSKKYFEILTNVNDKLYEGYFGYIYSLVELGETNSAISHYRKLASLNDKASKNDFLLAKICEKNAEFQNALDYLDSASTKAQNPLYYLEKAKINYYLKNYEESIDDLSMISKLPNSEIATDEAGDYLIRNYLKIGDLTAAQMYLNKKLTLDKNRIMYKYNLYVIYKLQGNEKIAATQFVKVKKSKPITVRDYIDLSEIYYEEDNFSEAVKILNKAIKKFPKDISLNLQKQKIYMLSGKTAPEQPKEVQQ